MAAHPFNTSTHPHAPRRPLRPRARAPPRLGEATTPRGSAPASTTALAPSSASSRATAYRYEGSRVSEDLTAEEAKALAAAVRAAAAPAKLVQNDQVVRVLATRSKPQLRATFRIYMELHGKPLEEDLAAEPCLREAVKCLDSPPKYFSEVIGRAFGDDADRQAKAALTRVLVSRADTDMEDIKDAYARQYGAKLADAVANNTHGHYKDALLAIIGK